MDAVNFFLNSSCLNLLRYGICYLSETLLFVHLVAFQTDTVLFCGLICRVEDMNSKFQVVSNRILSLSECMVLKLDIHLASLDFKINIPYIPSLESFIYRYRIVKFWHNNTACGHGFSYLVSNFACLMLW